MQPLYESKEINDSQPGQHQKKCPFCAELIQYEAIKCRYCHEFLNKPASSIPTSSSKWYRSNGATVLALLTLGPLALPLVWVNPRYSWLIKFIITVVVLIVTIALCYGLYLVYTSTLNEIKAMGF